MHFQYLQKSLHVSINLCSESSRNTVKSVHLEAINTGILPHSVRLFGIHLSFIPQILMMQATVTQPLRRKMDLVQNQRELTNGGRQEILRRQQLPARRDLSADRSASCSTSALKNLIVS